MSKLKKIDELLLFFISTISFLIVLGHAGIIELFPEDPLSYSESFEFHTNTAFSYDKDQQVSEIRVLNPDIDIYYSLNGGDSYTCAGKKMDLTEFTNPSLVHYQYAWRTNAAHYDLPSILSLTTFLANNKTKTRSDKICLNRTKGFKSKLPIVSIIISQDDFVGELNGMYALGESSWNSDKFVEAWWLRNANYRQRGIDWEKKVNFSIIENGKTQFEQYCGIKISGNATRGFPQKSFKIYSRLMYGAEYMQFPFFGEAGLKKYESLVLRTSGNDNTRTLFADLMIQKIADGSKVYVQKGLATQLFINGNYWGIYNLRERISQENLGEYYDCKPEKVTILENAHAELKDGLIEEFDAFHLLMKTTFEKNEISNEFINELNLEISIKSFMDYIFFETFFANRDWPHNNSTCYKIDDKKWKWALNDLDYALAYPGVENVNTNMFTELASSNTITAKLFIKLIENENFKSDFIKRCKSNIAEFIEERALQIFHESKKILENDIAHHIKRWRSISSETQWNKECEKNLHFIESRIEIYESQLTEL